MSEKHKLILQAKTRLKNEHPNGRGETPRATLPGGIVAPKGLGECPQEPPVPKIVKNGTQEGPKGPQNGT